MLDQLQRGLRGGGVLTSDLPGAAWPMHPWVGRRLVWWPHGIPAGERVGVVSSRLGSLDRLGSDWFRVLRQTCLGVRAAGQVLAAAQGTALAELIARCAQLFHVPLVLFELVPPAWSLERWLARCLACGADRWQEDGRCRPAIVSPPLSDEIDGSVPARDAIVIATSDRVIACRVRRGGNVCRLLERRLRETPTGIDPRVTLLVGRRFVGERVARDLAARGAACLPIADRSGNGACAAAADADGAAQGHGTPRPPILAADEVPVADYLVHCTRAADGPWPDQDRVDYLDGLIFDRPGASHSALTALARIVAQQRLLATGRAIRGGTPVVCFSAARLQELRRLRTFRAHRRRWDFQPYGVGVARGWFQQRGGRPVVYGDDAAWDALSDAERPYFQRRWGGRKGSVDWSLEREWRHVGHLDLADLPPELGFVFVPSGAEAREIVAASRWPVVVLS